MNNQLPQWILFDLDGTLLDSLPGIEFSVRAAFTACRLPIMHANLRELIGPPIRGILSRMGDIVDKERLDLLEQAFRASYDSHGWQMTVCFPEADRVLRLMRERGHQLIAVSNKPRHVSIQSLKSQGIFELFEEVVTRDSRSPAYSGKEEMVRAVQTGRGIASTDLLLVGDTIEDANAADANGIRFAFMMHGYGTVDKTSSVPVAWRLESLSEFLPLLEKIHD